MSHPSPLTMTILLVSALVFQSTEIHSFKVNADALRAAPRPRRLRASPIDESGNDNVAASDDGTLDSPSVVSMDDGGSDLTDRFKYKVHALMGTYDPPPGAVDDENQTGNIVGSLLHFPAEYTFTAVGKTRRGDAYAADVERVVAAELGADAELDTLVVPRGEKFTRVSVKVTVESAAIISAIYAGLEALETTVMKF